jgi:putative peptidoglycan lipid II flippase
VLLMASALLSGLLGLVRIKYVNFLFGAGPAQDAYRAAFALPDLVSYFLTGGAVSISLITILNRYRESGDEEGADHALSAVLGTMFVVLAIGILLAELIAPYYVYLANKGFRDDPLRSHLCTVLMRIILPGQLFFFIGSCLSARLQVRKIFIYQAGAPLIYNLGIILGAVFFHRQIGVYSLAVGVLMGVVCGAALLNAIGALRTGYRFAPIVNFRHPAFREWLKLSLPLMIGVSLVMFDRQFLNYFASTSEGGITLIGNAKDLFNAPFSVIGPAAGAASLPFFASLFQRKLAWEFSRSVTRAVSRLACVGFLVSGWMIAVAPWLMDLFRGGRYSRADAASTTHLFILLAFTLAIWAVQGIYARAFYAASDTFTPMLTGTIITIASIPLYKTLFTLGGLDGLALASDLGITIQTLALAVLLHRKRLVSLAHLEFDELGRALLAAVVGFAAAYAVVQALPATRTHTGDLITIAAGSIAWGVAALLVLVSTKSALPAQLMSRKSA